MSDEPSSRQKPLGWRDGLALGGNIALIPLGWFVAIALYVAAQITWLLAKTFFDIAVHPILPGLASVATLAAGIWFVVKLDAKLPVGKARRGSIKAILWDLVRTYTMGAVLLVTLAGILWLCLVWRPA